MLSSPPETRASLILRLPDAADVAVWEEFVTLYGPLVFRLAQHQGLQPADADDLVQEVFSAVARQIGDWLERPDRGKFRAWLIRVARNIAVNLLTRRPHGTVGRGGADIDIALLSIPDAESHMSSQFDLEYGREVYRWAAAKVSETVASPTWQAFQLTHVEGVSIPDAAARLQVTVGQIYVARSRVMSRLREVAAQFEVPE